MKKYYYGIIACLCLLTAQAQIIEFPLTNGNGVAPPGIKDYFGKGGNVPTNFERHTSEGLVLTKDRVGYSAFTFDNLEIDLREELQVEFEYALATVGASYAKGEGMAFFIYEATQKFEFGYRFEALGYAYNEAGSVFGREMSLAGSYLAIAFDVNGGFKEFFNTNESRREGISSQRFSDAGITQKDFGRYKGNHVTLRGAHAAYRQAAGYSGNPVLITKYYGGFAVNNNDMSMATLDYNTGQYNFGVNSNAAEFDVGNGGSQNNLNFQKIRMEFKPVSSGGIYITVKVIEGSRTIVLIDNFEYKTSFKTFDRQNILYDLLAPVPHRVKMGFTASTGNFTQQKTVIRNVKVTIPGALVIDDTIEEMCVSDSGASKNAEIKVALFDNINNSIKANTFKFLNENGDEVGTTYNQSNVGRWEYSASKEEVTLTLSNNYFEPGDEAKVYYVIEGTDGKKSQKAVIIVKGIACGAVANPHIRVKDKAEKYLN